MNPPTRGIELKRLNHDEVGTSNSQIDNDYDADDDDLAAASPAHSSTSSTETFELYTPDEEKAVLRKLDTRLVLFMSFLYLLSFLDRSNIGNAKIAGLTEDLRLKDDQFDWLLTAFYITYILFEWMILLYHILTPHVYISICVLSWGLIASLQALATNFPTMIVLRALLGISEAAFSPGVPFYLSFFFRREELALRAGMQVSAAPLAASFAGSLAWAITKLGQKSPFAPWRLLFLVEGFPSVIVAVFAWNFVPDSPGKANFLTPRQRHIASIRLKKANREKPTAAPPGEKIARLRDAATKKKRIDWSEIGSTLKDPKCYLTALMFSCCNIAFSSMPVFLPSIINEMGYSSIDSQALSAPPFLFAFVVLLLTARASDRIAARSPYVALHAFLGFVGYSLIAAGGYFGWPNVVRYLCVYPAAAGFFSAITIIITWTMNNQESDAKKGAGMTILNVIGQCGPLIGTRLFPDSDKPTYVRGMVACAGAMLIVFVLTLILRASLVFENRRRARAFDNDAAVNATLLREGKETPDKRERFVLML